MRLYAFGSNGSGQLGVGHKDDVDAPQLCLDKQVEDGNPVRLVASGNTTFLLFQSGRVYFAGDRGYHGPPVDHQSEESATEDTSFRPLDVSEDCAAKNCSATWQASFIVTRSDEVLVCGYGAKAELGLGYNTVESRTYAKLANLPSNGVAIVDIASSVSHSVVVLSTGEVYGWGNGRKGQLGEPADLIWAPRKIQDLGFSVFRAVCGREFTFLLGHPQSGQSKVLGADKWSVRTDMPVPLPEWCDVGACWHSILLLTKDNRLIAWGRNDRGQLAPEDLPLLKAIAVGSEHSIALGVDRTVLCWGWGEHGNCGSKVDKTGCTMDPPQEIAIPTVVNDGGLVGLGAGCATSFVWTQTD